MHWKAPLPLMAPVTGQPQLWVPIADDVISAAPQHDIVWADPLALLWVQLINVAPASNSVVFQAQTSADAGSNFDGGATDYSYHRILRWSSQALANSPGTTIVPLTSTVGNNAGYGVSGTILAFAPFDARQTCLQATLVYRDTANNAINIFNRFTRLSAGRVDGLRLKFATGNMASGRVVVRGLLEHGRGS